MNVSIFYTPYMKQREKEPNKKIQKSQGVVISELSFFRLYLQAPAMRKVL